MIKIIYMGLLYLLRNKFDPKQSKLWTLNLISTPCQPSHKSSSLPLKTFISRWCAEITIVERFFRMNICGEISSSPLYHDPGLQAALLILISPWFRACMWPEYRCQWWWKLWSASTTQRGGLQYGLPPTPHPSLLPLLVHFSLPPARNGNEVHLGCFIQRYPSESGVPFSVLDKCERFGSGAFFVGPRRNRGQDLIKWCIQRDPKILWSFYEAAQ